MRKLLDTLSRISFIISCTCLVAMTAIISYQVIARYFFNNSPAWSERLSLVLLAYLVFFGSATGVHERFHIRIDAVRNALPERFHKGVDRTAYLAVAAAGLVMMIAGFQLTTFLWAFDIPSLGLPRGLALLPLAVAGALITLFSLGHLFMTPETKTEKAQ